MTSTARVLRRHTRHWLLSPRRLTLLAMLTLTWCALWQTISVATVAGGIGMSIAVLATGVGTPGQGGIRLGALSRLIGVVVADLVTSTVDVAREILRRGPRPEEAIVAVRIPDEGRHHLLLLVVAVTLTPGTAVVDAEPDTGMLYLHLLRADRRSEVVAHVEQLVDLACRALPMPDRSSVVAASNTADRTTRLEAER